MVKIILKTHFLKYRRIVQMMIQRSKAVSQSWRITAKEKMIMTIIGHGE